MDIEYYQEQLKQSIEAGMQIEKLTCPKCNQMHNDVEEWAVRPHRTHLCLFCGHLFEGSFKGVSNQLWEEV